jgi:hypothetical protein
MFSDGLTGSDVPPAENGSAVPHLNTNGTTNHSRFTPDPPCVHCDKPVSSKQQDERGRYAHISCQRQADEVQP